MIRPITFEEQVVGSKNDGGIYRNIYPHDGILWGCGITVTSTQIEVASGMFILGGRMIWVDGKTTFEVNPTLQNGYGRLKAKIDLNAVSTQEECSQLIIQTDFAATEIFPELIQEDINTTGKLYEQELAVVKIEGGNVTECVRRIGNEGVDAQKLGGKPPQNYTMPAGSCIEYYGATAPDGYLFADGSAVSRVQYAELFAVLGTVYGSGDGTTTFNLPDKRGRVGVGKNTGTFGVIGSKGGEEKHVLTVAETAPHTHLQNAHNHTQNSHYHSEHPEVWMNATGSTYISPGTTLFSNTKSVGGRVEFYTGATTGTNIAATAVNQNTGGSQPHENMPPYLVCNYIIKY